MLKALALSLIIQDQKSVLVRIQCNINSIYRDNNVLELDFFLLKNSEKSWQKISKIYQSIGDQATIFN